MRYTLALVLMTLGLGAPALAEQAVTDFTLDNGMRAIVIEDHRAPVVTHMVWYKVGSVDEPAGKTGIAHFLEHLMFKGTEKLESGEFSSTVAENGGQDNAFTSRDYTAYFQRIASDRLGLVMSMEADRMRNIRILEEEMLSERDVVVEERNSRTDNDPTGRFREQYTAALYQNHGYGNPVIGWRHEIDQLDHHDAIEFYERFYAPNNAVLVVAGDVTPDEVRALAKKHYGPIEAVELPERVTLHEPPQRAARRVEMSDPRVTQPNMIRIYLAPSYVTDEGNEGEALSLLADIIGGGSTRRLQRRLTLETDLALYAGAYYWGIARNSSEFGVYAAPKGDVSMAALEGAIDWMIDDLLKHGVSEEELERARSSTISNAVYSQDSQSALARYYGSAVTVGMSVDEARNWKERLNTVTTEDILAVARKYLKPQRSVTGILTKTEEEGVDG